MEDIRFLSHTPVSLSSIPPLPPSLQDYSSPLSNFSFSSRINLSFPFPLRLSISFSILKAFFLHPLKDIVISVFNGISLLSLL